MIRRIGIALLLAAAGLAQDVSRMDQVVQSYVSNKTFMGSVLVARGDKVLLSKGYGSANLEWNIPNSPVTKFRLGSVTKQFTAASILLLEERSKLKTDDPVKKFMPDAPAAWDEITIFHLLTHTSGIPSFTSFPDYRSQKPFAATPEKLVARFRDKPLDFQPGEKWSYSNSSRQVARFPAGRKVELQQLGIRATGLPAGKGQRPELREVRAGEHLRAAGHEGFGLRFELRHHPAARGGLCAG
jgi:CubicO group peptidase (beta-lactamase class C family)